MNVTPADPRARLVGIGLMLMTVSVFPVMDATAKHLAQSYHVVQVVWARYTFHLLVVAFLLARAGGTRHLLSRRPRLQLARAALILVATGLFFSALTYVPLANCIAINFMAPLIAVAFSIPMLGERVEPYRWVALAIGFGAVLLVIRPGFEGFHPASLLVCVSAACYAIYQIITRKLAAHDHPFTTLMWTGAFGTVVAAFGLPFVWIDPAPWDWALMVGMGLMGGFSHYCLIQAYMRAPPAVLAPFSYTQIVVGTIVGYLWFGEFPDKMTILGAGIIIACGLYLIWREAGGRHDRQKAPG